MILVCNREHYSRPDQGDQTKRQLILARGCCCGGVPAISLGTLERI